MFSKNNEETLPSNVQDDDWNDFITSLVSKWNENLGERKQHRSKRREKEIFRAALLVFAREGISRARIGDIASEAGIPVSSIYEYYESKEELAYTVPIAHTARFYAEFAEAVTSRKTADARLRLYLWLATDFARRNPEWARTLYLEIWPSVLLSETKVRHCIDDYLRVIVRLIRQGEANGEWPAGNNPYETAAILSGSVNQIITTWLLYRKPSNLMKTIDTVIDRMMAFLQISTDNMVKAGTPVKQSKKYNSSRKKVK